MDTVFSHIVQKRFSDQHEDVATDALAFILQSSEAARRGFMKLLRGIEPTLPELTFRTQQTEGNIRPDMWGYDDTGPRIFVENKFWAGLTENQPNSYLDQLSKLKPPTLLLVIGPAAREQSLWRELKARLKAPDILLTEKEAPAGVVFSATTQLDQGTPILALTSWRRVLSAIKNEAADDQRAIADLAQLSALCDAADSQAFVPLSARETSDQTTPAFILSVGTIINDAVQLGVAEGLLNLDGLRPQASWDRIGRYIRFTGQANIISWFGIHLDLWKRHGGTPAWLVFQSRVADVRHRLEPWAFDNDKPTASENDHFCLGVELQAGEEKDQVIRSVVDCLKKISSALQDIPPPDHSVEPADD